MSGKTILILGGGVGGIVTANALRERLASVLLLTSVILSRC